MKIHEYQARTLLEEAGVPVPSAEVITDADQAAGAFSNVGSDVVVLKAQVHAGGRGKAGYVALTRSPEEAEERARWMFANRMVNRQTGPEGVEVKQVLLTAGVDIEKEYYLGMVVDRGGSAPVVMASAEGGVEIEEVAACNHIRPAGSPTRWALAAARSRPPRRSSRRWRAYSPTTTAPWPRSTRSS